MRFLIDQDVYAATTRFLKSLGHDAVTACELALAQASEETLLRVAAERKRIPATRDRDHGALVTLKSVGAGVRICGECRQRIFGARDGGGAGGHRAGGTPDPQAARIDAGPEYSAALLERLAGTLGVCRRA